MTPFTVFCLWVLACWLVWTLTHAPLQPDQLVDDLGDVELSAHGRRVIDAETING